MKEKISQAYPSESNHSDASSIGADLLEKNSSSCHRGSTQCPGFLVLVGRNEVQEYVDGELLMARVLESQEHKITCLLVLGRYGPMSNLIGVLFDIEIRSNRTE